MYQALYRKWRPKVFDDVIGQDHITRILCNQIDSGKLSHAYLFIGSRGTGKTTCARILAQAVNCEHPVHGNPCCSCASCRSIMEGAAPEIVEIDAASNNGVDDVRALRDEAIYSPASLKKRVYIVDEVHMLSKPAFNALLKIIEEPPAHLLFILATTELNKVPATILSRCQRFNFKRIQSDTIAEYLKVIAGRENLYLTDEAALTLARMAEGGMRDALSLLDQCSAADTIDNEFVYTSLGLSGNAVTVSMLEGILRHDSDRVIRQFTEQWVNGKDPSAVLKELNSLLRDVLIFKVCPESSVDLISGSYSNDMLAYFNGIISGSDLICMMERIQKCMSEMRDAANPKLSAELCLSALSFLPTEVPVQSVSSRVTAVKIERNPENIEKPVFSTGSAVNLSGSELQTRQVDPAFDPDSVSLLDEFSGRRIEAEETVKGNIPLFQEDNLSWDRVVNLLVDAFPPSFRAVVTDPRVFSGSVDGNVLKIEIEPGFSYTRYATPSVAKKIGEVLREKTGKDFRIVFSEKGSAKESPRDINELRQFDIVSFK